MHDVLATWGDVFSRLGMLPVGATEDGLRYVLTASGIELVVDLRSMRDPPSVRVVVRTRGEGSWLVASTALAPSPSRWKTGDPAFDERVVLLSGGKTLLPRLGKAERDRVVDLVSLGAILGSDESTFEPAVVARFGDSREIVLALRDLMRIASRLANDPPIEELVDRWVDDDAPMVASAVARRVVELLPSVTEAQAEGVCRLLLERGAETAMPLLTVMPPYPCVLAAWFKVGDPLDPRVAARVIDAWASGSPRPAARYLAWLLHQPELQATMAADKLSNTPGVLDDPGFVREFVRAVRKDPPTNALPLLLKIKPRSSSLTRRIARVLSFYRAPEVDRRLLEWLSSPSSGVRQAAGSALADRVLSELTSAARPHEGLELVRRAAERSSELIQALLERLPSAHNAWLATIRPHGEPDAIALIRRLGQGGAEVDEPLMFWLDRGTLPVRLEAAHALGTAGTAKVLAALRERAASWFSDGGVRESCKAAGDRIRDRVGGAGSLALAGPVGGELAVVPDVPPAVTPPSFDE